MKENNWCELGEQMITENNYDKAGEYFTQAIAENPLSAKAYLLAYKINEFILKTSHHINLCLLLELILSLDSSLPERSLLEKKLEEYYERFYFFIWREPVIDQKGMDALYSQATQRISTGHDYGENFSFYGDRGYMNLYRKNYQAALQDFITGDKQHLRKMHSNSSEFIGLIAKSYYYLRDYENAEKMFYKYLSIEDRSANASIVIMRSLCLYRLKKYESAREALTFNPNSYKYEEPDKARLLEWLEKLISEKISRLNQFKRQETDLRKKWMAYYSKRDFDSAQKVWNDIHFLNDDDPEHYLYAGLLFIQIDQRAQAIHYLRVYINLSKTGSTPVGSLLSNLENQQKAAESYDSVNLFSLEAIAEECIEYSLKGTIAFSSENHDIPPLYANGELTTSKKNALIKYLVNVLKVRNINNMKGFGHMQWVLVEHIARLLQTYIKSKNKSNRNLKFMVSSKDLEKNTNQAFRKGLDKVIGEALDIMRQVENNKDALKQSSQGINFSGIEKFLRDIHKENNIPVAGTEFFPTKNEVIVNALQNKLLSKQFKEVIKETEEILVTHPKNAMVYYCQGRAYEGLDNAVCAIESYKKAIQLSPQAFHDCEDRLSNLTVQSGQKFKAWGKGHEQNGTIKDAIICYSECLLYMPQDSEVFLSRGHCNMQLENYNDAELDFENAIRLSKPNHETLYALALIKEKLHKYSEALPICNNAIALKKDEATFYYLRAIIKDAQENSDGAIADMEHAIKLNKGDYPEAIEALRKFKNALSQRNTLHAAEVVQKRREEERKRQESVLQLQKPTEKTVDSGKKAEMTESQFNLELSNLENSLKSSAINKSDINKSYQELEKYAHSFQSSRYYLSRGDFYLKSAEIIPEALQKQVLLDKSIKDFSVAIQYDPFDSTIAEKIKLAEEAKSKISFSSNSNAQFFKAEGTQKMPPQLPARKPRSEELSPEDQARLAAKKEELRKKMGM